MGTLLGETDVGAKKVLLNNLFNEFIPYILIAVLVSSSKLCFYQVSNERH